MRPQVHHDPVPHRSNAEPIYLLGPVPHLLAFRPRHAPTPRRADLVVAVIGFTHNGVLPGIMRGEGNTGVV